MHSVIRGLADFSVLEPGRFNNGFFAIIDQQHHVLSDVDAVQG